MTVGEGIDGLLGNLVRLLVGPGTPVVTSAGAYPTFAYHVAGFGGRLDRRALPRRRRGPRGAAARRAQGGRRRSSISPTPTTRWAAGTARRAVAEHDRAAARRLRALPRRGLCRLRAGRTRCRRSTRREPRVIRMRTFSKAHGMAGARIGYALGHPELIAAFDRVRNHFGVNRIAQAGALAALGDRDWLARVVAQVGRGAGAARRDRRGERARGAALGDELRRRSTAGATGPCPARAGRAGRARHLRAHALRRPAGPLHPRHRRPARRPRRLRRGAAGGAGGGGDRRPRRIHNVYTPKVSSTIGYLSAARMRGAP